MFMVTTKGECLSILKSAQAIPITHTTSALYPSKGERPIHLEWINKKTQIKIAVKMLNDVHGIFNAKIHLFIIIYFWFLCYCVYTVYIKWGKASKISNDSILVGHDDIYNDTI